MFIGSGLSECLAALPDVNFTGKLRYVSYDGKTKITARVSGVSHVRNLQVGLYRADDGLLIANLEKGMFGWKGFAGFIPPNTNTVLGVSFQNPNPLIIRKGPRPNIKVIGSSIVIYDNRQWSNDSGQWRRV